MISKYPKFEKLTLEKKADVDKFFRKFKPYSDFNFVSLYSWDTQGNTKISLLNDNLIVSMPDYITGRTIFTFLGNKNVLETCKTLLRKVKEEGYEKKLKLIPQSNLRNNISKLKIFFEVKEDPDNYDYVISVENLIHLKGNNFSAQRKQVRKFLENNPKHEVKIVNSKDNNFMPQVEDLFLEWAENKRIAEKEFSSELTAVKRALKNSDGLNLLNVGIYIDKKLVSFTINETLGRNFYMGHFGKSHYAYKGLSKYAEHITAKHMKNLGCSFMNYEQDLGIETLRQSKLSWRPINFLKKYIIESKE